MTIEKKNLKLKRALKYLYYCFGQFDQEKYKEITKKLIKECVFYNARDIDISYTERHHYDEEGELEYTDYSVYVSYNHNYVLNKEYNYKIITHNTIIEDGVYY